MTQDDVRANIDLLFNWYRRRYLNAETLSKIQAPQVPDLSPASYAPEQHVLIGCALDALAIDWATLFRPELVAAGAAVGNRMSEFLVTHANDSGIFNRVAAPMLADQLVEQGEAEAAHVLREVSNDNRNGIVRFADDDPTYDVLANDPKIVAVRLQPAKPGKEPRGMPLRRYRFGQVIYADHRCGWAHNLRGSRRLAPSDFNAAVGWDDMDDQVRYQNVSVLCDRKDGSGLVLVPLRRPIFSLQWLFAIYSKALASFERGCIASGKDPLPLLRRE